VKRASFVMFLVEEDCFGEWMDKDLREIGKFIQICGWELLGKQVCALFFPCLYTGLEMCVAVL